MNCCYFRKFHKKFRTCSEHFVQNISYPPCDALIYFCVQVSFFFQPFSFMLSRGKHKVDNQVVPNWGGGGALGPKKLSDKKKYLSPKGSKQIFLPDLNLNVFGLHWLSYLSLFGINRLSDLNAFRTLILSVKKYPPPHFPPFGGLQENRNRNQIFFVRHQQDNIGFKRTKETHPTSIWYCRSFFCTFFDTSMLSQWMFATKLFFFLLKLQRVK